MRSAGIFEAKQKFSQLIDAVEAGEEVRITPPTARRSCACCRCSGS